MYRRASVVLAVAMVVTTIAYGNVETVSRIFKLEHVSVSEASAAIRYCYSV